MCSIKLFSSTCTTSYCTLDARASVPKIIELRKTRHLDTTALAETSFPQKINSLTATVPSFVRAHFFDTWYRFWTKLRRFSSLGFGGARAHTALVTLKLKRHRSKNRNQYIIIRICLPILSQFTRREKLQSSHSLTSVQRESNPCTMRRRPRPSSVLGSTLPLFSSRVCLPPSVAASARVETRE